MSGWLIPNRSDPVERSDSPITIEFDGRPVPGIDGQTIAGVLVASGITSWRTGPDGRPRGLFCGIGVCFDCLATVNDMADVRVCRRRAIDGDIVSTQDRSK